jgi:hypothetical protein
MPIGGAGVAAALPRLRRVVDDAGRDPAAIRVVRLGTVPDPGKLDYYASLGVHEVAFRIPSAPAARVLPLLDEYAPLVARFAS